MTITDCSSTVNTTRAAGREIRYIVIHYTAGVSSAVGRAAKTAAMFAAGTRSASADFIVDDGTAVQYNPDIENRYCWHCGGSKYNSKGGSLYGIAKNKNSIGIEICSTNTTNSSAAANAADWYYTDAALETARELTVYLMDRYGIDADHVIRHYDVTGKLCPGIIGWNADSGDESKWEAWHASLTGTDTAYTARVTASTLNVRSGPGTSYSVTGRLSSGDIVTVTRVSGAWAYIGTGWVSTAYLTEITEEEETVTLDDFKDLMQQYRATLQDNDASTYSEDARAWAVNSGIVQGGSSGDFNGMWEDYMTREQLVTVLYRFAQMLGQA